MRTITARIFLLSSLSIASMAPAQNPSAALSTPPYIEVIVATDKIWLLPEEVPLSEIHTQLISAEGKVLLAKTFSGSTENWWIDISLLTPGRYCLQFASGQREYFEKRPRKRFL